MKTTFRILATSMLLLLSQLITAQNPATSTKYTDAEVNNLIKKYQTSSSRDASPNAAVSQQFRKDFPASYDIDWEMGEQIYKVEFEIDRKDYNAYYDSLGNLLMYIFEIKLLELPAIVKNAAQSKYIDYKFDRDPEKIIKGKNIYYKIPMERKETEIKAIFKSDGSFVKEYYD